MTNRLSCPRNEINLLNIPQSYVWKAYYQAKLTKKIAVGIDGKTLRDFQSDLNSNICRLWRNLSSGNYQPPLYRRVTILKNGKSRVLGNPTVSDYLAQLAVRLYLREKLKSVFHRGLFIGEEHNYSKVVKIAVASVHRHCQMRDWVLRLDIKDFSNSINQQLLLQMTSRHVNSKWMILLNRWLNNPQIDHKGVRYHHTKGVLAGPSIHHLLTDLYLHHAFDDWMKINFAHIPFERYGDDMVCHCLSKMQAEKLFSQTRKRLSKYHLMVNSDKSKIVYCKDGKRRGNYIHTTFDYLKYRFEARRVTTRKGTKKLIFSPGRSSGTKRRRKKGSSAKRRK
ncbi:reverse transcriptase domain-containing protein [Marininema halotolerans]|uniref:Group II intron reverse transcriptase/maturase n=1 Tax=Marininema halotolerans TaxID=1155944 RepID=A0A1I6PQ58_9BACL|nr:reverse transcriptase domain-containing protein [Marininema halotolerans]SFS42175.1 group II intron reverse transcriptase/maturase [Marininema halotolerans]